MDRRSRIRSSPLKTRALIPPAAVSCRDALTRGPQAPDVLLQSAFDVVAVDGPPPLNGHLFIDRGKPGRRRVCLVSPKSAVFCCTRVFEMSRILVRTPEGRRCLEFC